MTVLPRYILCWYNLNFLIISIANSRSNFLDIEMGPVLIFWLFFFFWNFQETSIEFRSCRGREHINLKSQRTRRKQNKRLMEIAKSLRYWTSCGFKLSRWPCRINAAAIKFSNCLLLFFIYIYIYIFDNLFWQSVYKRIAKFICIWMDLLLLLLFRS